MQGHHEDEEHWHEENGEHSRGDHAVGQARIGMQADDGRLARDQRVAGGNADSAGFVQRQDVGGLRCRHGCEKGRFRRPRIAEYEGNFIGLEKILNEFAACSTCHRSLPAKMTT